MASIRKILVATDFSPPAAAAQGLALALARDVGASVTLLHAYLIPTYQFFDGTSYIPPAHVVADIIAESARGLAQATEQAAASGIAVETVTAEGNAAEVIAHYASQHGFDLIVVGTHGRRGIGRVALGSIAERVVRTATVPVLTVRG